MVNNLPYYFVEVSRSFNKLFGSLHQVSMSLYKPFCVMVNNLPYYNIMVYRQSFFNIYTLAFNISLLLIEWIWMVGRHVLPKLRRIVIDSLSSFQVMNCRIWYLQFLYWNDVIWIPLIVNQNQSTTNKSTNYSRQDLTSINNEFFIVL